MGCGKTTIGKLTAQRLGRPFIDLDEKIEELENRTINEIFDEDGEDYFRKVETQVLKDLDPQKNLVIATGGGIVLNEENRNTMKDNGVIVYLNAPIDELVSRLKDDDDRPLLHGESKGDKLRELYEERQPYYLDGSVEIKTGNFTPLQAAKEIVSIVK